MLNVIKKIYKLIKSQLSFVYYNIEYIKKTSKSFAIEEKRYAIVNIDDHLKKYDYGRYFYIICMYLNYSGFNLIVKTNWYDFKPIRGTRDLQRLLLKQKYSFVRNCSTQLNTIVLVQPNLTNHIIHLSYGYNTIINSAQFDCIAPYPIFPNLYKYYLSPTFLPELKNLTEL
ncbi:MAG: hypothetical protein WKG06_38215 [Segetibacter sp.]